MQLRQGHLLAPAPASTTKAGEAGSRRPRPEQKHRNIWLWFPGTCIDEKDQKSVKLEELKKAVGGEESGGVYLALVLAPGQARTMMPGFVVFRDWLGVGAGWMKRFQRGWYLAARYL
jgi:hypothetical protein